MVYFSVGSKELEVMGKGPFPTLEWCTLRVTASVCLSSYLLSTPCKWWHYDCATTALYTWWWACSKTSIGETVSKYDFNRRYFSRSDIHNIAMGLSKLNAFCGFNKIIYSGCCSGFLSFAVHPFMVHRNRYRLFLEFMQESGVDFA